MVQNDNKGVRSIQTLLNISLILQLLYFTLSLFITLVQKPFVEIVANILNYPYEFYINWGYVIVAVLTTVIFAVFYIIFSNKLKTGSVSTFGFGSLLCISSYISIFIIPVVVNFIENYMFSLKIIAGGITAEIYGTRATLAFIMSFVNDLSLTAIVLLLCAYSMYWFKVRNCLNTTK